MQYPSNIELQDVTILFADLRGFTSLAESYPMDQVVKVLNAYLSTMCDVALKHGGTIDKFMGDAIMVLFGVPASSDDDALRALICAAEMQHAMSHVNHCAQQYGFPELFMGIGVNSGLVMAGIIGSDRYSEQTVVGDEVNVASRIEAYSLRGQVLLSQNTLKRVQSHVLVGEGAEVYVKGKKDPVVLHELLAIPAVDLKVPDREVRRSPRVEVAIPVEFHVPPGQGASSEVVNGVVRDMGYHGMYVELDTRLEEHAELKLNLNFALNGKHSESIRVRVVGIRERGGRIFCNVEFTSISVLARAEISRFLQRLIQGGRPL